MIRHMIGCSDEEVVGISKSIVIYKNCSSNSNGTKIKSITIFIRITKPFEGSRLLAIEYFWRGERYR